jgi:hypothetical protein
MLDMLGPYELNTIVTDEANYPALPKQSGRKNKAKRISIKKFIEMYGACGDKLDEDTWLCWMGIWQSAWQEAQSSQNSELIEFCKEIAKKPYSDSDLISLFESLKSRAKAILDHLNQPVPKS